ncbi:MAG: sporulation protein YunB [Clostridiales bacterium]|nr:sporulation protein YunB [Clostridiales bacterium]
MRLLFLLLVMAVLLFVLDCQLRPIVRGMAASQTRVLSTRAINEAVSELLSEQGVQYEDLSTVTQDEGGNVQSVHMNTVAVNRLKADVMSAIQRKFSEKEMRDYSIPVGTLTGSPLLLGRGPGIPLRLQLMGSITSEMESEFVSAGVNQTCHRIVLNLHAQVYGVMPGNYHATEEISTNFIIAEMVIVGDVPDTFLQMNGDNSALLSKILQEVS